MTSLGLSYSLTQTSKVPLAHYMRGTTYLWAVTFIYINHASGKADKLLETLLGQMGIYLILGTLGELFFHRSILKTADKAVRERRYAQSLQEILVASEALLGVCAFSCCVYEVVDPLLCPYHGYFKEDGTGVEAYTPKWAASNVAFYLVFCDAWFYWWHYAFHAVEALWPMHYQHHQLREPTSFGGPTVHVIELVLEYTLAHHLVQYLMPFHPHMHRALGAFAFIFGAIFNHGGLSLDYNSHFAHHITWKGGRAKYCNYGMFFPFWDQLMGTRYDASAPPASAARPKEAVGAAELERIDPYRKKGE